MLYKSHNKFLEIQEMLAKKISNLENKPRISIIVVGSDRATRSFVNMKKKFADAVGIDFETYVFDANISTQDLTKEIEKISISSNSTALVVQLPLPKEIDTEKVLATIPKSLDADVLSPAGYELFLAGGTIIPPVARAVMTILDDMSIDLNHKSIVIVGMGRLVGAPVYDMLQKQGLDIKSVDINTTSALRQDILLKADIIISGTGIAHSICPKDIKSGVTLIDAGTSEQSGTLAGDIDPKCAEKASFMTSVPGGVGPLTVACLFCNIVELQA